MAADKPVRVNLQQGTIGSSLASTDTTIHFGGAPGFPSLAVGDFIPITILSAGALTKSEIVHLTGYTAGNSTGQIDRGQQTALGGGASTTWSASTPWEAAPTATEIGRMQLFAAGNTTATSSTTQDARSVTLHGAGAVSVGYEAGSIRISGPRAGSWSQFNSAALYSSTTFTMANTSPSFKRIEVVSPLAVSRIEVPVSISLVTAANTSSAFLDLSYTVVIYTRSGTSTLNPVIGTTSTKSWTWQSSTGVFASLTGPRILSFDLGAATTLQPNEYYIGIQMSTNNTGTGANTTALGNSVIHNFGTLALTATNWAEMSAATAATWNPLMPMQGIGSVSISATQQTYQASDMTQSGATAVRANLIPILRNV